MENETLNSPSEFDINSAVRKWRSQGFSNEMIELAGKDMADYGLPYQLVAIYMDVKISAGQAQQLSRALKKGVSEEFVRYLAGGGYSAEQIRTILQFAESVPAGIIQKNVTSDMKAHAIHKVLQAVKDSLEEAEKTVPEESGKVKELLDSIREELSVLSQNAELIQKVSEKLEKMPKPEAADEEQLRKEYEKKLEQKETELSIQQDQINKLMKTKTELRKRVEQMTEEHQSAGNLRKEMEEMKRSIGELERQIKERDSRDLEKKLLQSMYRTQQEKELDWKPSVEKTMSAETKKAAGQTGKIPDSYQTVVSDRYGGTRIVQVEHVRKKGPEHLLALAGKKCFRSKAKYSLIRQMKEADLSKEQMEQIRVAIESGLTDSEVSDIIGSGFDVEEMEQAIQILLADKLYQ